jgi:hypothetical protein
MASGVRTLQVDAKRLPLRVGRSRSQDLVVDWAHEGVSGHHLELSEIDANGAEVVVHGDNGVAVDGTVHEAGARFRWRTGQRMRLGRASEAEPECVLALHAAPAGR